MPLFTPGISYKWSAKTGKYRAAGGKRNKRPRVVARTTQNVRRMKSLNKMLGTLATPSNPGGYKSRMRLAKTSAQRFAAYNRRRGAGKRKAA